MSEGQPIKTTPETASPDALPLQMLLFVNNRPNTQQRVQLVLDFLEELRAQYAFELQIIDVGEQPYLAEYYRLVATPTLIKIHPEPRHTLAGSNLVEQIQHWWSFWRQSAQEYEADSSLPEILDNTSENNRYEPVARQESPPSVLGATVTLEGMTLEGATIQPPSSTARRLSPMIEGSNQSLVRSAEFIQLSDEIFRLKKEKEELENQLKFKDQIIAMLAHDLRNPITAASLALETLEMGHDPTKGWHKNLASAQVNQLLNHARNQIKAIDRMITDILSRMQVQPQKLNLHQLCLDVLEDLSDRVEAKSLQLVKDIPSDLPFVLADHERIRQVLINLLDNAIKYTPAGGKLSLAVLHRKTQEVLVSISDNGPGIPAEDQERIFENHYRLKRDQEKDGYGIGLALCRRIVRAHCGKIWVDSTIGQGSSFHFTLPVLRA